jgi:hypothetical protein
MAASQNTIHVPSRLGVGELAGGQAVKFSIFTSMCGLLLGSVAMLSSQPVAAQGYTPEEKQKLIEYGEQHDTAWDLYQSLV